MKKLLTTITLSALVGTSASNLKPMFTNNVVNHGFKSNKNLTMINSPFIKDFKDLKDKKIEKVIVAPNGTIYAGSSGNGLWKSTDGINFINIYPKNNITSIAIAPNGTIYASINQKLSKSTDSGITFQQVSGISNGYYINSIAIAPDGTIWVGTNQAGQRNSGLLYKSTDGINFKSLGGISEAIKVMFSNLCNLQK